MKVAKKYCPTIDSLIENQNDLFKNKRSKHIARHKFKRSHARRLDVGFNLRLS